MFCGWFAGDTPVGYLNAESASGTYTLGLLVLFYVRNKFYYCCELVTNMLW